MEFPFDTGFHDITWQNAIMICIGLGFIYLAIAKKWEPYELLPIGAGIILANLPLTGLLVPPDQVTDPGQAGILGVLRHYGIFQYPILPVLIFLGLGGLPMYYICYKAKLVPRWLSAWGFLGASLVVVYGFVSLFGQDPAFLAAPIAVQEMVFAVWLIAKGFNTAPENSKVLEMVE